MIDRLKFDHDMSEMQIDIWQKLNEVIDVVNGRASLEEKVFGNYPDVIKAAKKAATTGSKDDLQAYLKLRRKYL